MVVAFVREVVDRAHLNARHIWHARNRQDGNGATRHQGARTPQPRRKCLLIFFVSSRAKDDVPEFDGVELNGMKMADPSYLYSALWQELGNPKTSSAQAQALLEQRFTKRTNKRHLKPWFVTLIPKVG
jgi:hypothetical protein